MAEWLNATVLKTVVPLRAPWVRIPLSPPFYFYTILMFHKKQSINVFKFSFSLVWIILFLNLIINAEFFKFSETQQKMNTAFIVGSQEDDNSIDLNDINAIAIEQRNEWPAVISYIVQRWDNLYSIAQKFWVTVSNLKNTNNLSSDRLKVWSKITVSEQPGIIYEVQELTNLLVFANKYNLNINDLKSLNYIETDDQQIYKWDELFISISTDEAIQKWLLWVIDNDDEPVQITRVPVSKPTSRQDRTPTVRTRPAPAIRDDWASDPTWGWTLTKRVYNKKINNSFAPGNCTWYAAIRRPDIFPWISETRQQRTFWGNAIARSTNAKKAGYKVWTTPAVWAIFVSTHSMPYGHVGIVTAVNRDNNTMTVEDMNYAGKYIVTRRVVPFGKNTKYKRYIY